MSLADKKDKIATSSSATIKPSLANSSKVIKKKKIKVVKVFMCHLCKSKFETSKEYAEHLIEHDSGANSSQTSRVNLSLDETKAQKTTTAIPIKKNPRKSNNIQQDLISNIKTEVQDENQATASVGVNKVNSMTGTIKKIKVAKLFVCLYCPQKFKSETEYKEHLHEHQKNTNSFEDDRIQCEYCPHVSLNMSRAIQHKHRLHPNFGNHYCQVCGKLFPIKIALIHHLKNAKHNDEEISQLPSSAEKPTCSLCLAQFITETALTNHAKTAHTAIQSWITSSFVPAPSTKIVKGNTSELFSVYYCHLCGSDYMIKHNLKQHLLRDHTEADRNLQPPTELIRCIVCTAIFYSLKAFETHQLNHSDNDLFATNEEERRKVVNRIDQDFDLSRVPITFPLGGNWLN